MIINCETCGAESETYRRTQRFCSKVCRDAGYYAVNRERLNAKNTEYNAANKEALAANAVEYYAAHRERIIARTAARYADNRERLNAKNAEYYADNREMIAAKNAEYRAANRERISSQKAEYYAAHPEKSAAAGSRRRARKANAEQDGHTLADREADWQAKGYIGCVLQGPKCTGAFEHVEHLIPLVRGGSHTLDNLAPSCASCNLSKGIKTLVEWRATWHEKALAS